MAVTVAIEALTTYPRSDRVKLPYAVKGQLTFDASYSFGGESISTAVDALFSDVYLTLFDAKAGYQLEYDRTNKKVKVFTQAPAIVVEEKHTAVAYTVTLDHPAAWIINVCQAGQNMAWEKTGTAYGSLSANSFCLKAAIADGVRTQLTLDGETDTVYVTYVTQAWKELYALLVQDEAVTLATGANNLANKVLAFGYCHAATSGRLTPVDIADTTADGEVGVKFNFATGALDINAAQNTEAAVVTYLKAPTSGWILDRFIPDEDPAKSGSDPYIQTLDRPCLLWLLSGCMTINGGATLAMIEEDATPATGEFNCNFNPGTPQGTGAAPAAGFVLGGKDNVTATACAYLFGQPWEIPGIVPLEVKEGTDLSDLVVQFLVIGEEA